MGAGFRGAALGGFLVLLGACTAGPPKTVARVTSLPAAQSAPAAQSSPPVQAAVSNADLDAKLVREGYHVVRKADQVRYCRTVTPTGTAFSSEVCLTSEQVAARRRSLQQSQQDLTLTRGFTCARQICNGGT